METLTEELPASAEEQVLPRNRIGEAYHELLQCLGIGFIVYYATTFVVLLGVLFGDAFVTLCTEHPEARRNDVIDGFSAWDGVWYYRIASEGYASGSLQKLKLNFYPAYPLLSMALAKVTGIAPRVALPIVSHVCLLLTFSLLYLYLKRREPPTSPRLSTFALLALGLFPTSLFLRMAYSESLFLLLTVVAMFGIQQRWPSFAIALVIGSATACRPVGIALSLPFLLYLRSDCSSIGKFAGRLLVLLPFNCWGLAAFMLYQQVAFDDAFAFVRTSAAFNPRLTPASLTDYASSLLTAEPIRAVYEASSSCYWANHPPRESRLLSLHFANPIYFVGTGALLLLGIQKRWLSSSESLLSVGLLTVPYVTHVYKSCMGGAGRYAMVIFPVYIVLSQILIRLPKSLAISVLIFSACLLFTYSVLYSSWYWIH